MSSSAWSLNSMKVLTLHQCGSEVSVTNHQALVIRSPVMFSRAKPSTWTTGRSTCVNAYAKAVGPVWRRHSVGRLGRLAVFSLRAAFVAKTAAGNCSNKRANWRFRMRLSAAVQALMALNEARSATLQARGYGFESRWLHS